MGQNQSIFGANQADFDQEGIVCQGRYDNWDKTGRYQQGANGRDTKKLASYQAECSHGAQCRSNHHGGYRNPYTGEKGLNPGFAFQETFVLFH